jgi:hypothetical protein
MKTILVIGQKYNDWTVLKFEGVDQKRRRRYFCRCKCGEERSLAASSVFAGRTKQCSKCKALTLADRQFFDWVVLSRAENDKHGKSQWLCRCKCGKEAIVSGGNLNKGTSKCCFDCGHNVYRGKSEIPASWWIKQVNQAASRGREWKITEEEAMLVMEKQQWKCTLTGLKIGFHPMTASIDRIDSDGHYEVTNIQWVFKPVNAMKFKYKQDYFIYLCHLIAENTKKPVDSVGCLV